jgi:hypothetical protein
MSQTSDPAGCFVASLHGGRLIDPDDRVGPRQSVGSVRAQERRVVTSLGVGENPGAVNQVQTT